MTEGAFKRGMAVVWTVCALMGATPATAQQIIRVGWTIPAEESKYWMMKRPAEFPDLGKTYNIEWVQFQGTAPMTQDPQLVNTPKPRMANVMPRYAL